MARFINSTGSGASSKGINKMLRGQNPGNNGQFYMERNQRKAKLNEKSKASEQSED